jgi:hypothetical protein
MATTQAKLDAIDRLGKLKARIAVLQAEHDTLEEKLRSRIGRYSTDSYEFSVFDVLGKKFNWSRAKRLLGEKYESLWIENSFRSSKLTKIKE